MLRSTAIALSLLLSACATSPVSIEKATPVPADRLLAFQDHLPGGASITVLRDSGFTGSGCYGAFTINGTLAARFAAAESANFYVPAGDLLLRYGSDPQGKAMCGLNSDYWVQRETVLNEGENKIFRLSINASGALDVMRVN